MARAKEGKDGRPPRFDPVLDEVATKLEKEVFELKCQHLDAKYCLSSSYHVPPNRWPGSSWERELPQRLEIASKLKVLPEDERLTRHQSTLDPNPPPVWTIRR